MWQLLYLREHLPEARRAPWRQNGRCCQASQCLQLTNAGMHGSESHRGQKPRRTVRCDSHAGPGAERGRTGVHAKIGPSPAGPSHGYLGGRMRRVVSIGICTSEDRRKTVLRDQCWGQAVELVISVLAETRAVMPCNTDRKTTARKSHGSERKNSGT